MKKLDDSTFQRFQGATDQPDAFAREQRRVIFSAFGRRETADNHVVNLVDRINHDASPAGSPDLMGAASNLIAFPLPAVSRRKA